MTIEEFLKNTFSRIQVKDYFLFSEDADWVVAQNKKYARFPSLKYFETFQEALDYLYEQVKNEEQT